MLSVLWLAFGSLLQLFRNRRDLIFENFVLRQQLTVLKRRRPRPALNLFDKLFWVAVSRLWSQWKQSIIIVTPETVVRWHRAGFRMYWRLISRVRGPVGRRPTTKELRELIFRMVAENPTWGAISVDRSNGRIPALLMGAGAIETHSSASQGTCQLRIIRSEARL